MWHEVKKLCPYFYDLKLLLDGRKVSTFYPISNSVDPIDTSSLLARRTTAGFRTKLDDDEQIDVLNTQNSEANRVNLDLDLVDPGTTVRRPMQARDSFVWKPTPAESEISASDSTHSESDMELSDCVEIFKASRDAASKRKRLRDEDKQETRRLEIRLRHYAKMRRMDLKEREMELQERKLVFLKGKKRTCKKNTSCFWSVSFKDRANRNSK